MRIGKGKLIESETGSENTILFCIDSNFEYCQGDIDDSAFESAFDDQVILNYHYNFWRDVDRTMISMIDKDPDSQNLADYVDEDLQGVVTKIDLHWNADDQVLEALVHLAPGVDPNEESLIEKIKDYLKGQMADGWGEGFEQQDLASVKVYAVQNTDNEWDLTILGDEQSAIRLCNRMNRDVEVSRSSDDEEDEDFTSEGYDWFSITVTLCCHFYHRRGMTVSHIYINGRDAEGYDKYGYDAEGYDKWGRDKDGYDADGYSATGYDREGFNRDGFDRNEKDREGFDKHGEKELADRRPTNTAGKKSGALFNQHKDGTIRIRNTFDMGESRKKRRR